MSPSEKQAKLNALRDKRRAEEEARRELAAEQELDDEITREEEIAKLSLEYGDFGSGFRCIKVGRKWFYVRKMPAITIRRMMDLEESKINGDKLLEVVAQCVIPRASVEAFTRIAEESPAVINLAITQITDMFQSELKAIGKK